MTPIERREWRASPLTKQLIQQISTAREGVKETWAMGGYPQPHQEAEAKGAAKGYIDVLDMIDMVGGLVDESGNRELEDE